MSSMRVFITGGTGFVGQAVTTAVALSDHKVLLLTRQSTVAYGGVLKNVTTLVGDLHDRSSWSETLKRFDPEVTIHLAWQAIPNFSASMCLSNLQQSIELLDFLSQETRCQKVIISGSCFEYGEKQGACVEDDCVQPTTYFVWAKQSLCQYGALLAKEKGTEFIWFRIFYVYGPGQRKESLLPMVVQSFRKGKPPLISHPYNANDFVYVEDVAKAFVRALSRSVKSGTYNLGSGQTTTVADFCQIVEQQIQGNIALTDQMKKITTSIQRRAFWADIRKTQRSLDWRATTSLSDGIQAYLKCSSAV